jgi:Beta-propeller repeat
MILAAIAFVWQTHFGGPGLADSTRVYAASSDSLGNVVITGQFSRTSNFGGSDVVSNLNSPDIFIAKYNSAGAYQWSLQYGSTGTDVAYAIGTDSSNNIYVTGNFSGTINLGGATFVSAGGSDIFIAKYSSAGAHVWSRAFAGTGNDTGSAISVSTSGTFVIAGTFANFGGNVDFGGGDLVSAGGPDIFIAKYDSSGNHLWSKRIGGAGNDFGLGVSMNDSGTVAVTGYFSGVMSVPCMSLASAGTSDVFVATYSTAGDLIWARRFGGTGDDKGLSVAITPTNETVVTGYFNQTIDMGGGAHVSTGGGDIFLAKYASAGTHIWSKTFGTNYAYGDLANFVAIDSSGNIAIIGNLLGPIDFGGGPKPEGSSYDVFVAKFAGDGTYLSDGRYGVLYDDIGYGVAFAPSGHMFVVGAYLEGMDFGSGTPMPSPGGLDGFLAKIGP